MRLTKVTALVILGVLLFSGVSVGQSKPVPKKAVVKLSAECIAEANEIADEISTLAYQIDTDIEFEEFRKIERPLYAKTQTFADKYPNTDIGKAVANAGSFLEVERMGWEVVVVMKETLTEERRGEIRDILLNPSSTANWPFEVTPGLPRLV